MSYALVSFGEAIDLGVVIALTGVLTYSWKLLRRRDRLRRVERKEREAEYKLHCLRCQKEWERAQRYYGTGVH